MAEIEIFTTPDCPRCKKLMFWMDAYDIKYKAIDATTVDGMAEAAFREIVNDTFPVVYMDGDKLTGEPADIFTIVTARLNKK
jgi:glutaredoxin